MMIRQRQQCGAAMIEMVVITPVLLLLLLGVSELGKAFAQYNTLNKSVREAARQVAGQALLGTTGTVLITAEIDAAAKNLVVYGNIAGNGSPRLPELSVDHVSVSNAGNGLVLVQADYPYIPITGPVLKTFGFGEEPGLNVALTASVVMRAL
jgi:Flp pilus assembly protein TadG